MRGSNEDDPTGGEVSIYRVGPVSGLCVAGTQLSLGAVTSVGAIPVVLVRESGKLSRTFFRARQDSAVVVTGASQTGSASYYTCFLLFAIELLNRRDQPASPAATPHTKSNLLRIDDRQHTARSLARKLGLEFPVSMTDSSDCWKIKATQSSMDSQGSRLICQRPRQSRCSSSMTVATGRSPVDSPGRVVHRVAVHGPKKGWRRRLQRLQ
jgi:hypothetical protein